MSGLVNEFIHFYDWQQAGFHLNKNCGDVYLSITGRQPIGLVLCERCRWFFQIGVPTSGGDEGLPTRPWQAVFAASAPRRLWSCYQNGDLIGSKSTYSSSVSPTTAHVTKYLKENGFDVTGNHAEATDEVDYNNERVIRLSDARLLRAEALLESNGSTQEVIAPVNRFRARVERPP